MRYFKRLAGKKCYLSPMNPDDAPKYAEWLNDLEITVNLDLLMQVNLVNEKEFIDKNLKDGNAVFAIVDLETDMLIGNCGLMKIDRIHRNAEFGIFIGDKNFWKRGFGGEATRLILDYSFNILNLENIFLRVLSYNKKAIHVYEKAGFKQIGLLREFVGIAGKRYDFVLMDILAEEFESPFVKNFIKD